MANQLTAGSTDQPIRFELEERCSPSIALVVGFQGAALMLAPTALNVAVAIRSSGLDDTFLTWGVFAALLISAAITGLQSFQLWRFGAGHIVLSCPAALFIAIMAATISAATAAPRRRSASSEVPRCRYHHGPGRGQRLIEGLGSAMNGSRFLRISLQQA